MKIVVPIMPKDLEEAQSIDISRFEDVDIIEWRADYLAKEDIMTVAPAIFEKFSGGPVGLDTLAAALGEDAGTLEDVYEPYLLMNGLINRTPRGRMATENAYRHLGLEMK